jgi:predicted nucleic acid-binding protein
MGAVVDASFLASVMLPDEVSEASTTKLEQLAEDGVTAPALLQIEITNLLVMAERRKRITEGECRRLSDAIDELPIIIQPPLTTLQRATVLHLSREHELTAYDATYLELALRLGHDLATHDVKLRKAAGSTGVALV